MAEYPAQAKGKQAESRLFFGNTLPNPVHPDPPDSVGAVKTGENGPISS
jgi:hypothetical protein